ncbi:MAG TPA: hypothetical protein PKY77_15830 [Phycisphaerae bacterium]|nr:hypothetical protein [Phycisphaerae bacterium]HRY70726.1 hypothetical protein [Phycisphaerae bacterium]HSA28760.1 hypothetical protein [Phycisphaerae bacterium]
MWLLICAFSVWAVAGLTTAAAEPKAPRIVNIVNFIRGVEPRGPVDLYEPVVQQIRLARAHGLPTTFLIQYDALIQDRFVALLKKELTGRDEVGAWLEVVQPQVEAAGLKWRGRFPWDWHTDVGFTIGYTPAEREKLIDEYMRAFEHAFGRRPRSVGCWLIDAHTLTYLSDHYGVAAACICKDQAGTDGYTLWGGYWNQAYYPSRLNAYMPAQDPIRQIPVPVFRMLGSDPIDQYDNGLGEAAQGVVTLEPVYTGGTGGGGVPAWVRWFLDLQTSTPCLAFAYTQAGQENSFGWPAMEKGLTDQVKKLAELSQTGRIRVETLGQSGQWFRNTFPQTPATAVTALHDMKGRERGSVWYDSRFYRANLFWDENGLRIRDIHMFDEQYPERYLNQQVTTHAAVYDTLPAIDGFTWSTRETRAAARPVLVSPDGKTSPMTTGTPEVTEQGKEALEISVPVTDGGRLTVRCEPERMLLQTEQGASTSWALELSWAPDKKPPIEGVEEGAVLYRHNGFAYRQRMSKGRFRAQPGQPRLIMEAQEGVLKLELKNTKEVEAGVGPG